MATVSISYENPRRVIEISDSDSPFSDFRTGDIILCDTSSDSIIITLPLLARSGSQRITVINKGSNSVTIRRQSVDTIDGGTQITLSANNSVRVIKTSAEWISF